MVKASALSADVAGKGRKKIISIKEKRLAAGKKPGVGRMAGKMSGRMAGKKAKAAFE